MTGSRYVMLALCGLALFGCGKTAPPADPALTSSAVQQVQPEPMAATPAPAAAPAAEPAAAAPAATSGVASVAGPNEIILQDFETGNGTEAHDVYSWDYGQAKQEVQAERANSGSRAMRNQGNKFGINFNVRSMDLTGYKYVFVWVYDTVGDNTIEFELGDMADKHAKAWTSDKSKKNQWVKVTISLDQFRGQIDLTKVKNIQFYEWNPGTYYFDDLGAGK